MSKTYAQLAREIAALQASAQRQLAVESKGAIAKINEMIAKFQLSASDLKFASSTASTPPSSKGAKAVKAKSAAGTQSRYSDGQGNVWGGRGPRPRWLRSALAAGRAIESFLTGATQSPPSAPALPEPPVVASAPARKVSAKKRAAKRASVASKAPAATTAVKTVAKTPAAKKSGSATTDRKAKTKAAVKKASMAQPATSTASAASRKPKKVAAKKAVTVKRAAGANATQKVSAKKVPAEKKPAAPTPEPQASATS